MSRVSTPTPRQLEVLRARCETGFRKGAAALLRISPETVRWHLGRLFARCGCVDEAQAGWRHREQIVSRRLISVREPRPRRCHGSAEPVECFVGARKSITRETREKARPDAEMAHR